MQNTGNSKPLVSVIMPVYNECNTVSTVIDELLSTIFDSFRIELIIIESNSNDGTKEAIAVYEAHELVRVKWQQVPEGKGAAVRCGLEFANGEIIIFQDADLEYSISDYPRLINPIINRSTDLVLGNRGHHGGPIRNMRGEPMSSWLTNLGHKFFTKFFNIMFNQKLVDPFTMYKVFRKECISDMKFVCNRFDFDWEILAKLCRRGYVPLEVPVSYSARGFMDGKKVKWFQDPISWIVTAIRCRIESV